MILLIGGTGNVGVHIAAALAGWPVRALVRTQSAADRLAALGIEPIIGDLLHPESVGRAFADVTSVYLATPGANQFDLESAAIDAAERYGVEQIVKVSILYSSDPSPIALRQAHHEIDARLAESKMAVTLLCPSTFMTHFLWQADLIASGRILFPAPTSEIAYVDPRDVADLAVAVLTARTSLIGAHAITGPEALSFTRVAERLTRGLGWAVSYEAATDESFSERIRDRGGSVWLAEGLVEIFLDLERRGRMPVSSIVEEVLGRSPRAISAYVDDYLKPAIAELQPAGCPQLKLISTPRR